MSSFAALEETLASREHKVADHEDKVTTQAREEELKKGDARAATEKKGQGGHLEELAHETSVARISHNAHVAQEKTQLAELEASFAKKMQARCATVTTERHKK